MARAETRYLAAEGRVLSWILARDPGERIAAVRPHLNGGQALRTPAFRAVYALIGELGDGATLDGIAARLGPKALDCVGGWSRLAESMDASAAWTEAQALQAVRDLADDAHRSALELAAKRLAQTLDAGEEIGAALQTFDAERSRARSMAPSRALERIVSARALEAATFAPLRWIVPGIIPEGVTILAGKPKSGKSWLALHLGLVVAAGGYALGTRPVERGEVLYLALEDPERRLQERVRKALGPDAPVPEGLSFAPMGTWRRLDQGGADSLRAWLSGHPEARLLIIDTLQKVRQEPASKSRSVSWYAEDYAALEVLSELAATYRLSVMVVHHTRKQAADDPLDSVSGSTGLTGAADTIALLDRRRHESTGRLQVLGRDLSEDLDLALELDEHAAWKLLGERAEVEVRRHRAEVLEFLEGERDRLHTPREIAAAIDKPYGTVKRQLRELDRAGQVVNRDGKYGVRGDWT